MVLHGCILITKKLPALSEDHDIQLLRNFMVITMQGNVPVALGKNIFAITVFRI